MKYKETTGFAAVMYNEVWYSKKVDFPAELTGLTALTLSAASGEIALLTVDEDWQFAMTIHYTGLGEGMDWLSGHGKCEVVS